MKLFTIIAVIALLLLVIGLSVQANMRINRAENQLARLPNKVWED